MVFARPLRLPLLPTLVLLVIGGCEGTGSARQDEGGASADEADESEADEGDDA